MTCQEARTKMFSYLDQELSLQEEEALFDHLSSCVDCGLEFAAAEETHYLLQKVLTPVVPPLDLTEKIMARISLLPLQNREESMGFGFRLKQYLTGIEHRWKDTWGSWQLKTAIVAMSMLTVFVFGSMSNLFDFGTPKKQTSEIALIEPKDQEVQRPEEGEVIPVAPSDTSIIAPDNTPIAVDKKGNEGGETPIIDTTDNQEGKGSDLTPKKEEPIKIVPKSTTNIVELPQATSGESRVETIKIIPLIESGGQNTAYPFLSDDGKFIHYLYDNAGMEEEWEVELKSGALPQKAQSNLIIGRERAEEVNRQIPQWLSDMDMIKEAKSKIIAWSKDQQQIAISLNTQGTDNDGLWVAHSDGGSMAHVTQEGGGNNLVWSPNRTRIAFTDGADSLYVFYLTENLLIHVTDDNEKLISLNHLFWTPDGQGIIFEGKRTVDGIQGVYRVVLP